MNTQQSRAYITNNCGNLSFYKNENREYDHPFIACFFVIDEFYVKLCENFDYYMTVTPTFGPPSENSIWAKQNKGTRYRHHEIKQDYPVMFLEDLEIHWIHEDTIEELLEKYNRRRERYLTNKPETVFFLSDGDMMNDHEPQAYNELVYRFTSLPNAIFVTRYEKIARFYDNAHLLQDWVNATTKRDELHRYLIHFINDRTKLFKKAYDDYSPIKRITNRPPQTYTHIANNYVLRSDNGDYTCNVFYVSSNECCVSIIRHDEETGWNENVLEVVVENEVLKIPKSQFSFARILFITQTHLTSVQHKDQLIPKVIIQTNETKEYKNQYDFLAQKSVLEANPEYEYVFFDKTERRAFLRKYFDNNLLLAYDMLVPGAFQADIFRIAYILQKGGCYLDFKVIARTSLRNMIRQDDDLVMCCDYERSNSLHRDHVRSYLNAIIFSVPHNSKFEFVLQACCDNILNNRHVFEEEMRQGGCSKILSVTGPSLLYEVLKNQLTDKQLRLKHLIVNNDESYYKNFHIVSLETGECLFTKTHKTYAYKNRYDELWFKREVFYKNVTRVGDFFVLVHPHPFPDTFSFFMTSDQYLFIIRNQLEPWGMNLNLKIVNDLTSETDCVFIGPSKFYTCLIKLDLLKLTNKPPNVFHLQEIPRQNLTIRKNVICISSVIYILDTALKGVDKRSALSHEERLLQTKDQLLSLRAQNLQDTTIILAECSNLPINIIQELSELCDYIFLYDDFKTFTMCHDNFENKSVGELHILACTLNILSKYDFEHFYKLGGRYSVTSKFNLNDFKHDIPVAKLADGSYAQLISQNGLTKMCYCHTIFYIMPRDYAIRYGRFIETLVYQKTNYTAEYILTLFLSSLNVFYEIDYLNVSGCCATNRDQISL